MFAVVIFCGVRGKIGLLILKAGGRDSSIRLMVFLTAVHGPVLLASLTDYEGKRVFLNNDAAHSTANRKKSCTADLCAVVAADANHRMLHSNFRRARFLSFSRCTSTVGYSYFNLALSCLLCRLPRCVLVRRLPVFRAFPMAHAVAHHVKGWFTAMVDPSEPQRRRCGRCRQSDAATRYGTRSMCLTFHWTELIPNIHLAALTPQPKDKRSVLRRAALKYHPAPSDGLPNDK